MPTAVTNIFQRARRAVAGFTMAQRTIAIIGLAVLALGIAALLSWASRPTMTPLFTGLSASDANAVVEQLRSASVSYELTDGGATVLVPESDVYDQRLAAAASGLPSDSSDGYSLLDDLGVTTSEFQQSVAYKRAIEGELAATISSLKGISAASVRLAIPEESVFVSETVDPTASVFVETGRTSLSPTQIEAIVHLTSAAVSGLKPENVAVVDENGRTLSSVGVGATGGVDRQAGDYEARVAASVQELLDKVVGPGNATVTVAAEIDRSVNERLEETYTPIEGGASSSEHTRTETGSGGQGGAGVLGPDNIAVPSNGEGSYEVTEETRNNYVNKATQTTSTPAGSITRQSISVAVDAEVGEKIGAGQLSDLVAAAAGIDRTRGDQLSVEMVPFSEQDAKAAQAALDAAKKAAEDEQRMALLGTALLVVAIAAPLLAVVVFLIIRARRKARQPDEFDLMFGERAASVAAYAGAVPLEQQPTVQLPLTAPEPTAVLPSDVPPELEIEAEPAQVSLERRRSEIETLSRRDPQRTAELLRTMLSDRAGV
ncbi:flagellar basal-body MS-ring/collar protein FliF [Microbacterium esteraromaticum]|uniref:flagellar basal-body MS-ring/collar protein FliF n=1 Tax=Microbacterium esteraromaticum TaxID=57043 RepID=UPI00195C72A8|nr:flagellar basal-body MS-ring/collar protein FliF [Microbacterium esteraromaticum]MBM7466783.1 flagellar M-ring protein FliF [Microbacterium esteraromaticum]